MYLKQATVQILHIKGWFICTFIDNTLSQRIQQFSLEFQIESIFKLEFQPEFGIQLGIPILMGINLGECNVLLCNMFSKYQEIIHSVESVWIEQSCPKWWFHDSRVAIYSSVREARIHCNFLSRLQMEHYGCGGGLVHHTRIIFLSVCYLLSIHSNLVTCCYSPIIHSSLYEILPVVWHRVHTSSRVVIVAVIILLFVKYDACYTRWSFNISWEKR